jgi:hypothetical protein
MKKISVNKKMNYFRNKRIFQQNKKDLLKSLKQDKELFGELEYWASYKMRFIAIQNIYEEEKIPLNLLCNVAKVSQRSYHR